jgi:hypothetical protein
MGLMWSLLLLGLGSIEAAWRVESTFLLEMDGLDVVFPQPHTLHSQGLSDMAQGPQTYSITLSDPYYYSG